MHALPVRPKSLGQKWKSHLLGIREVAQFLEVQLLLEDNWEIRVEDLDNGPSSIPLCSEEVPFAL